MTWNDPPQAGEVWYHRGPPAETRTVVDRTLGGDVCYVSGRFSRHASQRQCTEAEWLAWQAKATKR